MYHIPNSLKRKMGWQIGAYLINHIRTHSREVRGPSELQYSICKVGGAFNKSDFYFLWSYKILHKEYLKPIVVNS